MRVILAKTVLIVCSAIFGAGIYLIGCSKSTDPVEPKEYDVYFIDEITRYQYYRYNTGTQAIDSFNLPYDSWYLGFCLSPNGETMYLHPDGYIIEVELDSFKIVAEHPIDIKLYADSLCMREILVSPDGQYLAIMNHYLHILRLSDFDVVYSDTVNYYNQGYFSHGGNLFLCTGHDDSGGYVFELTFGDTVARRKHHFEGEQPNRVVAAEHNVNWYILNYIYGGIWSFRAYNPITDQTDFYRDFCPGMGDLEITPDGRYVIYSQPGTIIPYCPAPRYISIYDTQEKAIVEELDVKDDSLGVVWPTRELCITPDGRHLIGLGQAGGQLFDYDLVNERFNTRFRFGGFILRQLYSMRCQSRK